MRIRRAAQSYGGSHASFRTDVSLDCRKGTWWTFFDSAFTVCSRNDRLLLMNMASFIACPVAALSFVRSDPARSTKCSFEAVTSSLASPPERASTYTVKTQCERLDYLLRKCSAVLRMVSPAKKSARPSCSFPISRFSSPFTSVTLLFSITVREPEAPGSSARRSYMTSL